MIKLENHQFSPYNVITDSDKDQDAEIVGSLGIEYLHKASSRRLLSMTKKKCLCRCGNPTIHLPKWSSSVLHWGHLEASHALCWDSEDTATCRNSIPTSLTWTELQGETGAYPECATLCSIQMVCTLSNLQNCFFLSSSRMRRFGSQLGGTDFLPLRLPLCGLHHLSGSRFPRHPSTSRLKAWALLSRANLYLQGIRL